METHTPKRIDAGHLDELHAARHQRTPNGCGQAFRAAQLLPAERRQDGTGKAARVRRRHSARAAPRPRRVITHWACRSRCCQSAVPIGPPVQFWPNNRVRAALAVTPAPLRPVQLHPPSLCRWERSIHSHASADVTLQQCRGLHTGIAERTRSSVGWHAQLNKIQSGQERHATPSIQLHN